MGQPFLFPKQLNMLMQLLNLILVSFKALSETIKVQQ